MREIPLTQSRIAFVDDADYEWLNRKKWRTQKRYSHLVYAVRGMPQVKGKRGSEYMHRVILGLRRGDGQQCDHIDGNGLNNQRANLRVCTITQNHQNQRKRIVGTSKYKGACWNRRDHKWQASIKVNKKLIHLGLFDSELDAACAYNKAAQKYFGEFALLNTIEERKTA